jgi:hypothetical protein
MRWGRSCTINVSSVKLNGAKLIRQGLGDPGEDKEDQEALAVVRSLPSQDRLPDHLSSYERRRSMIQIEVS